MPIYKRCSRCNARIPSGTTCGCRRERQKEYDKHSRDKESKKFYDSAEWIRTKNRILELDGMDVYLFMKTGRMLAADTVHHIVPLKDDWSRRLDADNLMSLSSETHSRIERGYWKDKPKMISELTSMLKEFREMTGRGAV